MIVISFLVCFIIVTTNKIQLCSSFKIDEIGAQIIFFFFEVEGTSKFTILWDVGSNKLKIRSEGKYFQCYKDPGCNSINHQCSFGYPHCNPTTSYICHDGSVLCVRKIPICLKCRQRGYICDRIYPDCDFANFDSICYFDNKYYCVESYDESKCNLCHDPNYSCKKSYPDCNSDLLLETCTLSHHLICMERKQMVTAQPKATTALTFMLETTTADATSTTHSNILKILVTQSPNQLKSTHRNVTGGCKFPNDSLIPKGAIDECRQDCLPYTTYIDLSRIGKCSKGKICCLNKLKTEHSLKNP